MRSIAAGKSQCLVCLRQYDATTCKKQSLETDCRHESTARRAWSRWNGAERPLTAQDPPPPTPSTMPRTPVPPAALHTTRRIEPLLFNPARPLARMAWNPVNLYAMTNLPLPQNNMPSVHGQRMLAKRLLRSYHCPMLFERQFVRSHFQARFPSQPVTPEQRERLPPTQALLYTKVERRLETIVFRAHLAKSAMDARRAIVRGFVRINGQICREPGYMLRLGDMATVDPFAVSTLRVPAIPPPPKDTESEDVAKKHVALVENNNHRKVHGPWDFHHVPFMGSFMYTPRYLEVDYDTCSVVLVREPLPIPDNVEIPSPFPPMWHRILYEYYKFRYYATRTMNKIKKGGRPRY